MRLALARALFVKVSAIPGFCIISTSTYRLQACAPAIGWTFQPQWASWTLSKGPFWQIFTISVDLNALAWLEDYLQTWPGTLLVVYVFTPQFSSVHLIFYCSSHDRAFLDAVATDIVHQHSARLDYYKGSAAPLNYVYYNGWILIYPQEFHAILFYQVRSWS